MKAIAFPTLIVVALLFCSVAPLSAQELPEGVAPVEDCALGETRNVHQVGDLFLAGQFTEADLATIEEQGIQQVINLRKDGEVDFDEQAAVEEAGLEYVAVPFAGPEMLTDEVFSRLRTLLSRSKGPTLLHCGSANRVGGVWLAYRVLDQKVPLEQATAEARRVGLRTPAYEELARDYIARKLAYVEADQAAVPAGINDNFKKAELDIDEWVNRFEVESREVFAHRGDIVAACGIEPGMRVADVGAGTGIFTRLFSEAVGDDGWVYAVDIAAPFVHRIVQLASDSSLPHLTGVVCPDDSIALPPESVDLVYVCDTYHHFEQAGRTLASMHRALRPGGRLILIDFERIPGETRQWLLEHVRAGKATFQAEVIAAGFQLIREIEVEGLKENYVLEFRK